MSSAEAFSRPDVCDTLHGVSGSGRPSLGRVSTVVALADSLRTRILDGELPPGTQLREASLASEYGVARQSVRAALQSLSQAGLLVHHPNRGVFVPELDQADVADLFVLRAAVEVEAVTLLAVSGNVTKHVQDMLEKVAELPPDARWNEVISTELEFHLSIVQSTGSRRLSELFAGLIQELRLCLGPLQPDRIPADWLLESPTIHGRILESIRTGDPATAADEMRRHIAYTEGQLEAFRPHS
jgi:DNA-binding GntR family transcriptional regulator